tara:strand:- start:386 stop:1930 length:1545 start_codon:yes stop_codon:yes gene_type:complete
MFSDTLCDSKIIQEIDVNMLQNIENANIKLINEEKHDRDIFLQELDFNKEIVLIGSGPTLDRRINRNVIKEIFGDKINDNFYIVPVNDKWLYCDEFDFCIGNDELFMWGSQFMPSEKLFLTLSYSFGRDGDIPYCLYKQFAKNLLCIYQNNNSCYRPRKYNDHVFENNMNDILTINIEADTGGAIAIKVLEQMGFKKFKLIGFLGQGSTSLEKGFEYIEKFKFQPVPKTRCHNNNYDQFKNRLDLSFYKKFAFFIPTYLKNNAEIEMLLKNIQLLNKNMILYTGIFDIFIINNSVNKTEFIIEELRKNSLFDKVQILNNDVINAEIGIFKYFKNVKHSYKYYINIHDSCYIDNIFPKLENNLYYLWKTRFILNTPSAGGTDHMIDIKNFMNKYNLTQNNLYEKINSLNDNEILDVSDYFCFGCMFITNREILEIVYNKIKHILENNLDRRERMCLETILGFFLYEANKSQNICVIEEKMWGTVIPKFGNALNFDKFKNYTTFKYYYFTKFTLAR